jgi:hypothetical protein
LAAVIAVAAFLAALVAAISAAAVPVEAGRLAI